MKKSLILSGIIFLCLFSMTGCSNAIPEMDEDTREMVVEYAAAAVRKYNLNRPEKLMEYEELKKEEEVEVLAAETDAVVEQEVPIEENSLQPDADVEVIEQDIVQAETTPASLAEVLQLEEMTLSYEGYETKSFYPEEGEALFFVMNATEGSRLLVLKFKLQNSSQSETAVDLIGKDIRYKIVVNGETKNALTTMLLNDLSNYQGTLEQGAEEELVLICEVPEEQADQIDSLSIIVKNADETATISLN